MTDKLILDRRQFGTGLAAAMAALPAAASFIPGPALAGAGETAASDPWFLLGELNDAASSLGLSTPRMSLAPMAAESTYSEVAPAILDFMDGVEASRSEAPAARSEDVETLLERASDLLREVREKEKLPREMEEGEEGAAETELRAGPTPTMPPLEEIAEDYRTLFKTCVIREDKRALVVARANKVLEKSRRDAYDKVYEETCIPWYFTACIHSLEADLDFRSHLHNGDPLRGRTYHVPAGQPKVWLPPSDWASSAIDALKAKKYHEATSWTLPEVLYRWERYNGIRSRVLYHINTPYLWSFSQHYSKGKFVEDNKWSATAVSDQMGAAVILRALVDMGQVSVEM